MAPPEIDEARRWLIWITLRIDQRQRDLWGSLATGNIMLLIIDGHLYSRPWTIGSLAHSTGLNTSTISRRVADLITQGLVEVERRGKAVRLRPTENALARLSGFAAAPLIRDLQVACQRASQAPNLEQ